MKRMKNSRKTVFLLLLCVCLYLLSYAAASSGIETDEDGGVWDYNKGTYTDPEGHVYDITPGGVAEDDGGSGTVQNPDGSMTVITSDTDSVQENPDGSIEIESGTGGVDIPETTRAPLEGNEWQAVLNSVAARNGSETPTVWTDPATGETHAVEVVYMGIGRSMIILNGQKQLVDTVNLNWKTEAPEDKVLAVVDAPKAGYAWLRREPSNKITNPKLEQVRTDSVVRVIATGKNWTLVDYNGMRAYIQSSSLEFFRNDHTDFEAGLISVKGKTKGKDAVHVRSRDRGCRDLGEYRLGTPITVFDIVDEWAEVDVCGWHCRILTKYVTLVQNSASAE